MYINLTFFVLSLKIPEMVLVGDPGILGDLRMDDKFMYIPIDDTQNYPFSRLKLVVTWFDTQ